MLSETQSTVAGNHCLKASLGGQAMHKALSASTNIDAWKVTAKFTRRTLTRGLRIAPSPCLEDGNGSGGIRPQHPQPYSTECCTKASTEWVLMAQEATVREEVLRFRV
uniref:Uncharacterized protein n=1 Tax=Eutreptiella gymnastica TaxID=73025 RepID=A0A7S4G4N0_9EUGL|mmetsp:Transcript_17005/g.27045  ORF Transcript_17005/g.27045 Transcript_17005/m.27045 type:complete len:108 (+) Transcript_17005:306-629(+)